jgi:NAD(P)-dependent dehydrogenase (short-subunit alcohol dehydrogenase family)
MRLKDKIAIVVGAGQTPGDTIGNGRATAILFAREGGRCFPFHVDVTHEENCRAAATGAGTDSLTVAVR